MIKNTERSQKFNPVFGAKKQCWKNAVTLLLVELQDTHQYVEGFLRLDGGLFIEHGWLQNDTEIIDPTNVDAPADRYVPGIIYSTQDVCEYAMRYDTPFVDSVLRGTDQRLQYADIYRKLIGDLL